MAFSLLNWNRIYSIHFYNVLLLSGLALLNTSKSFSIEPRYVSFSPTSIKRCTLSKIRQSSLNICLDGQATEADLKRAKAWSARAVLTWMRSLKVIDEKVTRQIIFTCANKHLNIHLRPGEGTSFASPSVATIYSTRPYGTWTHELGHAFAGLGDTYTAGAGSCGSQPQSLMCWGAYGPRANPEEWSTLWEDDIKGIQANFRKVFPGTSVAPPWASSIKLELPLNPEAPWPSENFTTLIEEDHRVQVVKGPASEIDTSVDTESIDL